MWVLYPLRVAINLDTPLMIVSSTWAVGEKYDKAETAYEAL